MEEILDIILLFFAFSFFGWCVELVLKYRQFHRFVNRGFLMGPWLPIYGAGAVLITLSVRALAGLEAAVGTTFVVSFLICGTIEYLASYFMEAKFHARWWDYSTKPMNLHGRIWVGNLILFGIGGVLIVFFADPFLFRLFHGVSITLREVLSGGLVLLFCSDFFMTYLVLRLVKRSVESSEFDNTEEISREVRLILGDRNIFYRRFADAYPDVIYRTEKVKERLEIIRQETERLRQEAHARIDELNAKLEEERLRLAKELEEDRKWLAKELEEDRKWLVKELEPSSSICADIIEKQSQVIAMLYCPEQLQTDMRVKISAAAETATQTELPPAQTELPPAAQTELPPATQTTLGEREERIRELLQEIESQKQRLEKRGYIR